MLSKPKKPFSIAVAGGTATGKSYVVNKIIEEVGEQNVSIQHQDSYYKGGDGDTNYDEPAALRMELMGHQFLEVKDGIPVNAPKYKFDGHVVMQETESIVPKNVGIIEGTMILNSKVVRENCDLIVFIEAHKELMYQRRMDRDTAPLAEGGRGRTRKDVETQYFKYVLPGYNQYVKPTKKYAHIVLYNNSNNHEFIGLEILLTYIKAKINQQ